MNFPRTHKTRTAIAIGIAATSALMIVGPGSAAATAGRLIGSGDIKNNTVRSVDIRNGTVKGRDVKDGSLTAQDFSGKLRGATGPRGATGTRGPAGPAAGAATTFSTWTIHGAPTSNGSSLVTSTHDLPIDTQVVAIKVNVTGDFQNCPTATATVQLDFGHSLGAALWSSARGTWKATLNGGGYIVDSPQKLQLSLVCSAGLGVPVTSPAYDATVTLAATQEPTPTSTSIFD